MRPFIARSFERTCLALPRSSQHVGHNFTFVVGAHNVGARLTLNSQWNTSKVLATGSPLSHGLGLFAPRKNSSMAAVVLRLTAPGMCPPSYSYSNRQSTTVKLDTCDEYAPASRSLSCKA